MIQAEIPVNHISTRAVTKKSQQIGGEEFRNKPLIKNKFYCLKQTNKQTNTNKNKTSFEAV